MRSTDSTPATRHTKNDLPPALSALLASPQDEIESGNGVTPSASPVACPDESDHAKALDENDLIDFPGDGMHDGMHDERIPDFTEAVLERLYGHVFSSLAYHRLQEGQHGIGTYVHREGTVLRDVFLYRRKQTAIEVLNEGMRLEAAAAARFAEIAFKRYPTAQVLHFHAVDIAPDALRRLTYPCHVYNCTDDTVITLPASSEAYLDSLGKTTRKNLRRYQCRLLEAFPDYRYTVNTAGAIRREQLEAVIAMNRTRMLNKNKTPGMDESSIEQLWQLAQTHGMLGMASIAGRPVAGVIALRFGDQVYSFLRAHDPRYDDYRLGLLGGVAIITESIARGARGFHFLWGREPHKQLLGGVHKELHHVSVYRSFGHLLRGADTVLYHLRMAQLRRARLWLAEQRERDTRLWRVSRMLAHRLRRQAD